MANTHLSQATWFIDAVGGDDTNTGLGGSPIKTWREFMERIDGGCIQQFTTVTVMSDLDEVIYLHGDFTKGLNVVGHVGETSSSSTIRSIVDWKRSNTAGQMNIMNFSGNLGEPIMCTNPDTITWLVKDLAENNYRHAPAFDSSTYSERIPEKNEIVGRLVFKQMGPLTGNFTGAVGFSKLHFAGDGTNWMPTMSMTSSGSNVFFVHCKFSTEHYWNHGGTTLAYGCFFDSPYTIKTFGGHSTYDTCCFAQTVKVDGQGSNVSFYGRNLFQSGFVGNRPVNILSINHGMVQAKNGSDLIMCDNTSAASPALNITKGGNFHFGDDSALWGFGWATGIVRVTAGSKIMFHDSTSFGNYALLSTTSGTEVAYGSNTTTKAAVGTAGVVESARMCGVIPSKD